MSGLLDNGAGAMIHSLRGRLSDVTIAGNDALLPVSSLFESAGRAARGRAVDGWLPVGAMPPEGRALAADLGRSQNTSRAHPWAVYAAHATEVALDAIARSDGSRRSVAQALLRTDLRGGALGPTSFDARGDLRAAPVAILRAQRAGGSRDLVSADGADVVAIRSPR